MRKLFLFSSLLAMALSANAQFTVLKSGNVRIGSKNQSHISVQSDAQTASTDLTQPGIGGFQLLIPTDTLATMNLLGPAYNGARAYITFGNESATLEAGFTVEASGILSVSSN